MRMSDVMTPCPFKIEGTATADEALSAMHLHSVRHLPVVAEGMLIGVLTERDVRLSKLACEISGHCPRVGALCTKDPAVVQDSDQVDDVAREMADKKLEYALVSDAEGNLVGIFTEVDAFRLLYLLLGKTKSDSR